VTLHVKPTEHDAALGAGGVPQIGQPRDQLRQVWPGKASRAAESRTRALQGTHGRARDACAGSRAGPAATIGLPARATDTPLDSA
jgi:hypothetical protein